MNSNAKILIVDDKQSNLITLQTILEDVDAEFVQALSGDEALQQILHNDFALAILDVQMPEMDGYELAQFIRGREASKHLPVIFLSAVFSDDYHVFKGYESGAVDFISKPFESRILLNKVHVFLELYKQRRKLQHSGDLYKKTFDGISDMVMIQDENMRILRINKRGCKLLALSEKQILGRTCHELFHGSAVVCKGCRYGESLETRSTCVWEIEHEQIARTFQESSSVLDSDSGERVLIVHVARDITEQKQLERKLIQSEKLEAVGTLAGGIAHDFNNILTAILGYTEISRYMENLSPELDSNLEQIGKAGHRAKELVAQILTFSRKAESKRSPILISPVIKEALKLLRATIPTTIDVIDEISNSRNLVLADSMGIHRIIMNLCTNSFHAIKDERGTITVSLKDLQIPVTEVSRETDMPPGNYLQLVVSDTGQGMNDMLMDNIFDPFFTTKEKEQGTGMGLSVVHGIVHECGGTITVDSESGKGATFTLLFPVIGQVGQAGGASSIIKLGRGAGKILFVDDEPAIRELGKRYLEFLGYTTVMASSGDEALALFRKDRDTFTAVITDQAMSGLPGNLLAEELMRIRSDIPVILCTGYSSAVSEKDALQAGIKAYLAKPIAIQVLAETLQRVIAK